MAGLVLIAAWCAFALTVVAGVLIGTLLGLALTL
jgi:hypothetical protein